MTGQQEDIVISVKGLRNQFGSHVVHEDLDIDVRRGEILGVVGGSGTGKSVLLRTIAGLQKPAAGRVEVLGIDVLRADDDTARRPTPVDIAARSDAAARRMVVRSRRCGVLSANFGCFRPTSRHGRRFARAPPRGVGTPVAKSWMRG